MKRRCPHCGAEHECQRKTCKECGGFGRFAFGAGTSTSGGPLTCQRCDGTGYEPEDAR